MGNYPFTTIHPNEGVGVYLIPCPCAEYGGGSSSQSRPSRQRPLSFFSALPARRRPPRWRGRPRGLGCLSLVRRYGTARCQPVYGRCDGGIRAVPVRLLDVAGLIPGANEGRGLGCKFLDDLRCADVLLHVIDASGNTNEKASVQHEETNPRKRASHSRRGEGRRCGFGCGLRRERPPRDTILLSITNGC